MGNENSFNFISQDFTSRVISPCACAGGSYGPILWTPCVPAEQLEHLGWTAGVCVPCGHPGLRCISRWKSNLRNPPCSTFASNTATTKVRSPKQFLAVSDSNAILFSMTVAVCAAG